jgi:DNA-binding MarR family transcriptional regulator
MTKKIKSRGKPVLTPTQREVLAWLRAGYKISFDHRSAPRFVDSTLRLTVTTMKRLEELGYVEQRREPNGSETWHYLITIGGLEALREA